MSEGKSRFRIKNGEIEIEYEGSSRDVNERFSEVFEWVRSVPRKRIEKKKVEEKIEEKKEEKRGGPRKSIYPSEIQRLKEENFFGTKKSLDDVIKELESRGMPTRGKRSAIRNALIRDTRKKDSRLKGTKEDNVWVFWVD